jgi:hypothetical protein
MKKPLHGLSVFFEQLYGLSVQVLDEKASDSINTSAALAKGSLSGEASFEVSSMLKFMRRNLSFLGKASFEVRVTRRNLCQFSKAVPDRI